MTLRHLSIFIAVCNCKSVTAAAQKLYLAQPTVSLAIRELEEHYGVKLFDRIARKLYLTEPGKQLLDYASQIVFLFGEMEGSIREWDAASTLRVGASITIGTELLPGYVSLFGQSHPRVTVRAAIGNSGDIEQKILDNALDFALIEGTVHSPSIVSRQFMEDELALVCSNQHALAAFDSVSLEQIREYPFILREPGSGTRELFDSIMLVHNISVAPAWESTSTQAIIRAVAAGHGLSVLPCRLVKADLEAGIIKRLALREVRFTRPCFLIHHRSKFLTRPMREFMELCETWREPNPL